MLLFFLIIDTQNINHLERKIQRRNEREMDNTDQQQKKKALQGIIDIQDVRQKERAKKLTCPVAHDVF
jgi:hypothetical protein